VVGYVEVLYRRQHLQLMVSSSKAYQSVGNGAATFPQLLASEFELEAPAVPVVSGLATPALFMYRAA
jgi:hypothetical protein